MHALHVTDHARHVFKLARAFGALEVLGHLVLDEHVLVVKVAAAQTCK